MCKEATRNVFKIGYYDYIHKGLPQPVTFDDLIYKNKRKSSVVEQQLPFGNCKWSKTLPQMRGKGGYNHRIMTKYEYVHPTVVSKKSPSGMLSTLILTQWNPPSYENPTMLNYNG